MLIEKDHPAILRYVVFILTLASVFISEGFSQNITGVDMIYGYDPLLYNGRYYTFHVPFGTGGHQYFPDKEYRPGKVRLRGLDYPDLRMNYDIYNQLLVLNYKTPEGRVNFITVSDAWLESFTLGDLRFKIVSPADSSAKIFQVLGSGPVQILYHWKKDLELNTFHGSKNYEFRQKREMNLFSNSGIRTYHNNLSFYRLFENDKRSLIRAYIRRNRINVKKSDDRKISELADYCSTI